jgi:uncharacterized protein
MSASRVKAPADWCGSAGGRRRGGLELLPALLILITAAIPLRAEKLKDLKARGYVNDFAGVISPEAQSRLTTLCTEVDQKAQAQIAVVAVHNLGGDSVEDFTNRLGDQWGVGRKSSRGVLILLAVEDHKYRVEVGYGLEGILNDAKVGDFGRKIVPALKRSDYSAALLQLTWSVASVIAQDRGVTLSGSPPREPAESGDSTSLPPFVPFLIFLFLVGGAGLIGFLVRRGLGGRGPRGGGWWGGPGPWIGGGGFGRGGFGGFGGFGGGGGGGGGFGGFGGGSFGGGGASGSW